MMYENKKNDEIKCYVRVRGQCVRVASACVNVTLAAIVA